MRRTDLFVFAAVRSAHLKTGAECYAELFAALAASHGADRPAKIPDFRCDPSRIFPKPTKIIEGGRANGWSGAEIDAYITGRIAARDEVKQARKRRVAA
jgi:hypothetical protein